MNESNCMMDSINSKSHLFIVDPQVDFHAGGSLAVKGALEDALRISNYIDTHDVQKITVTLDTHLKLHIAHSFFWEDSTGKNHPPPFTLIKHTDVGIKWFPRDKSLLDYCLFYTKTLDEGERFTLCIWPDHCLLGGAGHCVVPIIHEALQNWSMRTGRSVNYIIKGLNRLTEMYSAIRADVPIFDDISTHKNEALIKELHSTDLLLICGQALSHCVNFTLRDLVAESTKEQIKKMHLCVDASSPVSGFEKQAELFVSDMAAAGVNISKIALL